MNEQKTLTDAQVREGFVWPPRLEDTSLPGVMYATSERAAKFDAWIAVHDAEKRKANADYICGQFTSDVDYTGAEVIGRIRSMMHALEPGHPKRMSDCIICQNDPEGF